MGAHSFIKRLGNVAVKDVAHSAQRVARRPIAVAQAVKLVLDPARSTSCYPLVARKGRARIMLENIWWSLTKGDYAKNYFVFGLDRSDRRLKDYMSWREAVAVMRRRNSGLLPQSSSTVLTDKFVFAMVAASLGYPCPKQLAILEQGRVEWFLPRETITYQEMVIRADGYDAFQKPVDLSMGTGAFTVSFRSGVAYVNGVPHTPEELDQRVTRRGLLQERIRQHERLASLYPSSVNTVRLVTVLSAGVAMPFAAVMRMGANGSHVDNWAAGGVIVAINLQTGRLVGRGFLKGGKAKPADRHPDTGVAFDGFELPYFDSAVKLACRFHSDIGGLHSIGWDIAFTPEGPCFLEGNHSWDADLHSAVEPGFKQRFLELA